MSSRWTGETEHSMGVVDIHSIETQHVKVDVEIQRRAKLLDTGDCDQGPVAGAGNRVPA